MTPARSADATLEIWNPEIETMPWAALQQRQLSNFGRMLKRLSG